MLADVGQNDVDEIGCDDEAADGDEIPFDAAHVDFVVGREDLDSAPDIQDREYCFLEKEDQLGDTEHNVVSRCPELGDTEGCVVREPRGDPIGNLDRDGGRDDHDQDAS